VVRHMWGVYTQSKSMRLPKFWQEAFEAAYEHLTSDVLGVRDAAVSEIAKMSMRSISLDPLPSHSQVGSSSSHFSCCLCIYIYIFFFHLLSQLGFASGRVFHLSGRETEQNLMSGDRIFPKVTNLDIL
jgi:hypothetical protein